MNIEAGKIKESELKKKDLSEKEIKDSLKKQKEFVKTKEKISVEIETENEIFHLKELVEKGVITNDVAKKIVDGEKIDSDEIKEIFEKIDEIEDLKDIDNYLPAELRISKDEYMKAVSDDIFRVQTITKLDSALTLLSTQINPESSMGLNLFSGFIAVLDKNLIKVQENTIDLKDSLKEIDEAKKGKKLDTRSLLEKIIDFIKELFV